MPTLSEPTPETCRGIVDAVPDAVVVVDATGCVRYANARAEVFFGSLRHQLVNRPAGELVPGLDHAVNQLLVDGGPDERLELSAVRPPTGEHPVEVWLARVTGGDELVAVTIRDDRERRSLREASARMRDELFASVSHELRTPLTSIIGYTELLVDMGEQAISEQAARLVGIIERNAERELRLVEDLLTLASLGGSGGLSVEPAPTELGAIADKVVRANAAAAAEADIELRCAAPGEVWVRGDAPRLEQVLRNLVGNAIKFTPSGGHVTVATSAVDTHGVVSVEDQGVGVAADELPLLFDGLFRGAHAVTEHLPGAGLGLPIVKGIVDAHGGEIDVESERGHGTRVLVRLPLVERPGA